MDRNNEEKGDEEEPSKKQKETDVMLCRELVRAGERGETERVRELLHTEGVDVNHVDVEGWEEKTALVAACVAGHLETARVILEHGGQIQEHVEDAFIAAAGVGRLEILQMMMMEKGVDPSVRDNKAVRWAAQQGRSLVVEFLLRDSRVDPAADDNEAVVEAAGNGHIDVLQVLLKDPRVDIAARNQQAICSAAYHGHVEVVKILLEDPRVDPGARNQQAICSAAYCGHVEVVKILLEDPRIDPAARENHSARKAARHGHLEVVKILLEDPRVDPAACDNKPVYKAARRGHLEVLKVILADQRVDGTRAIPEASALTVQVLLEDERCGIHANRALFEKHHPRKVDRFDELVEERTVRVCAVSWVMKQVGKGWGDVREPMEARMSAESVFSATGFRWVLKN